MMMQGETIPKETNFVSLSDKEKDEWGIPLLKIKVEYDENDEKILRDFFEQGTAMLEKAGCKNIRTAIVVDILHIDSKRLKETFNGKCFVG